MNKSKWIGKSNQELMILRRDEAVAQIRAQMAAIASRVDQTATATKFDWGDVGDLHFVRDTLNEVMQFWNLNVQS